MYPILDFWYTLALTYTKYIKKVFKYDTRGYINAFINKRISFIALEKNKKNIFYNTILVQLKRQ